MMRNYLIASIFIVVAATSGIVAQEIARHKQVIIIVYAQVEVAVGINGKSASGIDEYVIPYPVTATRCCIE